MKTRSLFGLIGSLVVLGVGSLPVQAQNRPNSTNTTTQPQVPTWRQFVAKGGGRYIQVDYDLPTEYKDGFVYFNQGASVINAFILKKGLSSYPAVANDSWQIDFNVADQYVKSGKAIQFNWNLGNSSLRYANDTEVRFPSRGTGCFRANCLTAPFFSNSEISRILRSKRVIPQGYPIVSGRSPQIAQNINQFNRFIIGTLSTGEKVLRVPKEYLSQSPFKEALQFPLLPLPSKRISSNGQPILYDANQPKVFLWDGKRLKFAGYNILSITDFKIDSQTYWVSDCYGLDCSSPIVSKPNFTDSRNINDFRGAYASIQRKDPTQNGFFYVQARYGNGWNYPVVTYLVDLRKAAANPNQSVAVCEVSRYTQLRNGVSPSVDNPNCRNGQQVMARRSPSSDQQTATRRSPTPVQTYRNISALGMAQFLQGKQELISAQEKLQGAAKQQYDIVEIPKTDFLEDKFTDVAESPGTLFGKRNDVSYGDYLKLKLKLKAQEKVFNKGGISIVKAIELYNNKLNKENRQGGRDVAQRISSNFNEYFNRVNEQNKKPSLSLEGIVRALPYAIEEARISDINLITGAVPAGGKLASAFTDLGGLVKLLNLPELTKPESFQRVGRSIDYVFTVKEKLGKIKEEFLKGNNEKVNDINLEIASETIKLIDAQDPKSIRTAEAIAIRSEAMNLIDRNKFLQQSQLTEVVDGFDKLYLTAAQVSSTVKMITSALAFIAPGKQAVRTFADKADAVNALLFNALQFTYKEDVRKRYELLKAYSNRNQQMISGLSSSIDFSAQEIGQYLIKTRTDVVTRRPDGTIAVSINGVVSPP